MRCVDISLHFNFMMPFGKKNKNNNSSFLFRSVNPLKWHSVLKTYRKKWWKMKNTDLLKLDDVRVRGMRHEAWESLTGLSGSKSIIKLFSVRYVISFIGIALWILNLPHPFYIQIGHYSNRKIFQEFLVNFILHFSNGKYSFLFFGGIITTTANINKLHSYLGITYCSLTECRPVYLFFYFNSFFKCDLFLKIDSGIGTKGMSSPPFPVTVYEACPSQLTRLNVNTFIEKDLSIDSALKVGEKIK